VIEKTGFVDQRKSAIESFLSSSLMCQQQNNAAPVSLLIFSWFLLRIFLWCPRISWPCRLILSGALCATPVQSVFLNPDLVLLLSPARSTSSFLQWFRLCPFVWVVHSASFHVLFGASLSNRCHQLPLESLSRYSPAVPAARVPPFPIISTICGRA
jgi:hypothetical protein